MIELTPHFIIWCTCLCFYFQRVHLDSLETTAAFRVAIPILENTVRAYATITYWLVTLSPVALVNFNIFWVLYDEYSNMLFLCFLDDLSTYFSLHFKTLLDQDFFSSFCFIQSSIYVDMFLYKHFMRNVYLSRITDVIPCYKIVTSRRDITSFENKITTPKR